MEIERTISDDLEVRVVGDVDRGEPQTWDHPGEGPSAEIHHVWALRLRCIDRARLEIDIMDFLSDSVIEDLESEMLEAAEGLEQDGYDDEMERRMDEAREDG
tara:strand:+ start:182 stop:487 length:306 start_codon:yes stop_codon:yes gene_type:complete